MNISTADYTAYLARNAKPAPRKARHTGERGRVKNVLMPRACALLGVSELPEGISVKANPGELNSWEKSILAICMMKHFVGEIDGYAFAPLRFTIGHGAKYTPDIVVRHNDGSIGCIEVKGYRHTAGIVRLKVAAKMYPQYRWIIVEKKKGSWVRTEIKEKA